MRIYTLSLSLRTRLRLSPKLKFRSFSRQITEVQLGRKVLNTMTALGRPVFERIS